jgi:hypothetical protein
MLFISKILFIELNTISLIMILYFEYLFSLKWVFL